MSFRGDPVYETNDLYVANSSITPLSGAATFAGSAEDVLQFDSVSVSVFADQSGTLFMEFSPDGSNWDSSTSFTVSANTHATNSLPVKSRYYRTRFVNGGTPQTVFRLQTLGGISQGQSVSISGSVSVTQGTSPWVVSGTVDTELTTADLDTGAGTDTRAVVGLVLAASGGGVLVGSANPMPISDNGGSITIDGSVSISGAVDTELPTPVALSDVLSNPTVPQVGAHLLAWTGSTWIRPRASLTLGLQVQVMETVAPSKQDTTVSTRTEVSVTGVATQLLASNASRKKVWIQNHGSGYVRVDLFTTATLTSPIRLVPQVGEYVIMADGANAVYQGAIFAASESGTNLVGVIEETA